MADAQRTNRQWVARARELRDRKVRQAEGVCFVEGIRQVLAAREGGWPLEAMLINPASLTSDVAWDAVETFRAEGGTVVELSPRDFDRIASRDNPAGIAAIVKWQPMELDRLTPLAAATWLVADDISDAGNLGTLIRSCDALDAGGIIVHGGVDPGHPGVLRASLGSAFQFEVLTVDSMDDLLDWCHKHNITTIGTSAKATYTVWDVNLVRPTVILVGNEGRGLSEATIARCDETVQIPMSGTATSLNVGVAAGIMLYEAVRQRSQR